MFNNRSIKEHRQIVHLLHKHLKGELSPKERDQLDNWVAASDKNAQLLQDVTNQETLTSDLFLFNSFEWDSMAQKLAANGVPVMEATPVRRTMHWGPFMAAAAVVIMIIGSYLLFKNNRKPSTINKTVAAVKQEDIPPGKYKARLTLADGSTIVLDSMSKDSLIKQGSVKLANKNGQLVYKGRDVTSSPAMNTLTTAVAETYQLQLSDGSKVWLNSNSSIRFPVYFIGNERRVEVTGEAFFEVTHNAQKPFIVKVNDMEVRVLGTTFNINAYSDEDAIRTTLLTGKVKISNKEQSAVLSPGQQLISSPHSPFTIDHSLDVDQVVAWRFGYFQFNNADLRTVMHQLERWYDVKVVYEGNVSNDLELIGKIQRGMTLTQVLNVLQTQQVHFRLEGHTIIVLP